MSAKQVLEFWFGEIKEDPAYFEKMSPVWFGADEAFDKKIRDQFLTTWEQARDRKLEDWTDHPRTRLALLLVLDQFSRNLFRGTSKAFAQDAHALDIAKRGVEVGADRQLHVFERVFFYLPFQHSENLEDQRQSITLTEDLAHHAPKPLGKVMELVLQFAIRHWEIIDMFGRFPHRNRFLGRESTDQEIAFLLQPNSSF